MRKIDLLDSSFSPMAMEYSRLVQEGKESGNPVHLRIALERENSFVSVFETSLGQAGNNKNAMIAERLVKFMLWSRGGWRLVVDTSPDIAVHLAHVYSSSGTRAFDAEMMEKIYGKKFTVESVASGNKIPAAYEIQDSLGGNLDGCRIGFDLGASDYKVAAVIDGEVVYSEETPWNPKDEPDPEYHYGHLNDGLKRAADKLPRVDAIGGSSAGVIVNNRFMVASLLRSIAPEHIEKARNLFLRLKDEWKIPLEVANDGDVTALAGAMSLGVSGLLGIAMGSSEAAGYINPEGKMTGWLNELAFAPVDMNPAAPADEWSGDQGVGAMYFSQQAVNKLLPEAGIPVESETSLPERLKLVQELMQADDSRAMAIYQTIGRYLAHALLMYSHFYDMNHVLVLGRVTTGAGGQIVLDEAAGLLKSHYPDLAGKIELHLPDEKSRRVGQAVAAASLPES